jgi:hypothetical protein
MGIVEAGLAVGGAEQALLSLFEIVILACEAQLS